MKDKKIPGTNISIPLSVKKAIIILNYTAKFGIKKELRLKNCFEHEYELTIPKYEVIGVEALNSQDRYKLYDMSGLLSSLRKILILESMLLNLLAIKNKKGILNSIKILLRNRQRSLLYKYRD